MLHVLWCPDQLSSLWMRHKMEHAFECVEANMKCAMIKPRNFLILPLKGKDWIGNRNGFFAVLKQFLRPAFVHLSLPVIRQKHKFAFQKKTLVFWALRPLGCSGVLERFWPYSCQNSLTLHNHKLIFKQLGPRLSDQALKFIHENVLVEVVSSNYALSVIMIKLEDFIP